MSEWRNEQFQLWNELNAQTVVGWSGTDWAIDEDANGVPFFDHPSIPFRQLFEVGIELKGGERFTISNYQNDGTFGLSIGRGSPKHVADLTDPGGPPSHTRAADLSHLPVGRIDQVTLHEADADATGDVTRKGELIEVEVEIAIGDARALLIAGEVYARLSGEVDVMWADESVLVFDNPELADSVEWIPPRNWIAVDPGTNPAT